MKACLNILFAMTGALSVTFAGPVPGPAASQTFLFASPNTRESLTDEDARAGLASFEQINATAVVDRAACALTRDVHVADSLGIYDKSSENSYILEADLSKEQSEYLAAVLGLYSRQEFVLLFLEHAGGPDRLWIVKTPQSPEIVIAALRRLKLTPVTVRTARDQSEIWFIDIGEKHADALKTLASNVDGRASLTAGAAEMLGDQDRATAIEGWRRQIHGSEQQSGLRLSRQLSSKAWRGATAAHTCSTGILAP